MACTDDGGNRLSSEPKEYQAMWAASAVAFVIDEAEIKLVEDDDAERLFSRI